MAQATHVYPEAIKETASTIEGVLRVVLQSRLQVLQSALTETITRTVTKELLSYEKKCSISSHSSGVIPLPIFQLAKTVITTANSLVFFGPELTLNDEFLAAAQRYPEDLLITAEILRLTPSFAAPFIAPIAMRNHHASKVLVRYLIPLVEKRMLLKQRRLDEKDFPRDEFGEGNDGPCDIIQFFVDANLRQRRLQDFSAPPPCHARKIVQVIIGIWFAAVHQPAITIMYALDDLLDHPEHLGALRDELNSKSMDTIDQLCLLDSFLKESSRLHPSDAISVRRKVLQPYTFSDGTHLRVGDVACVPSMAIMQDPAYYGADCLMFDAFRFLNAKGECKTKFTDTSPTYPLWGLGTHS